MSRPSWNSYRVCDICNSYHCLSLPRITCVPAKIFERGLCDLFLSCVTFKIASGLGTIR